MEVDGVFYKEMKWGAILPNQVPQAKTKQMSQRTWLKASSPGALTHLLLEEEKNKQVSPRTWEPG